MVRLICWIFAAMLLFVSEFSSAQSKVNIYVSATTPDQVGRALLFNVRERIARSARYQLTSVEESSLFQMRVVTLDQYPSLPGTSTVYSFVMTGTMLGKDGKLYISNWVGYCGMSRAEECAGSIISEFDSNASPIVEALTNSFRNTK